jgi:hypothetical protein
MTLKQEFHHSQHKLTILEEKYLFANEKMSDFIGIFPKNSVCLESLIAIHMRHVPRST